MGTITLFIATSLDGYIARTDGSLDWLPDQEGSAGPGLRLLTRQPLAGLHFRPSG